MIFFFYRIRKPPDGSGRFIWPDEKERKE